MLSNTHSLFYPIVSLPRQVALKFRTKGDSQVRLYCENGTKHLCRIAMKKALDAAATEGADVTSRQLHHCEKVHFRKLIQPHTDMKLGDCSYLDACRHLRACKFVHYTIDLDEAQYVPPTARESGYNALGQDIRYKVKRSTYAARYGPQWVNCDVRKFDFTVLGKFPIVMADPPWDIHMDLPYGTMKDDEMVQQPWSVLQDDGVIARRWCKCSCRVHLCSLQLCARKSHNQYNMQLRFYSVGDRTRHGIGPSVPREVGLRAVRRDIVDQSQPAAALDSVRDRVLLRVYARVCALRMFLCAVATLQSQCSFVSCKLPLLSFPCRTDDRCVNDDFLCVEVPVHFVIAFTAALVSLAEPMIVVSMMIFFTTFRLIAPSGV
jgi:hypothetical protein